MILKLNNPILKIILTISIPMVWFLNGLFCKVLNLVPRHQMIVARILGEEYSAVLTKAIGVSEILIAIWFLSKLKSRWCTYAQITIVMTMNIIETILAPDLLLFGRLNLLFAFLFVVVVYWNEFYVSEDNVKNHPFAVETFFESSLVLTFAVPIDELKSLIPECLELDTFDEKWAFVAMAMVQTKNLRPKGFPKFMGNDFFLTGYRIFVRYTNNQGKRLRGLYIIKSETDSAKMSFMGNIFTHYS